MAYKYLFSVDETGRVATGTAMLYPDIFTQEGDQNVYDNQERAFLVNGAFVVYDKIILSVPASAAVDAVVSVSVTLPTDTPDASVDFQVSYTDSNGQQTLESPITETVTNGAASHDFQFAVAGTYTISVSSVHHGGDQAEVTIE